MNQTGVQSVGSRLSARRIRSFIGSIREPEANDRREAGKPAVSRAAAWPQDAVVLGGGGASGSADAGEWHRVCWVTGGELGVVLQSPVGSVEAGYALATGTVGST